MTHNTTISEEIVIVGAHHGQLSDVIAPIFEKGEPIVSGDIKERLGGDLVYLAQTNDHIANTYAVGVYTITERRIGYVWMHQAPALREYMEEHNLPYIDARITRLNSNCKLLICKTEKPLRLAFCQHEWKGMDWDWASEISKPFILKQKNISLCIGLIKREVENAQKCTDNLKLHIKHIMDYMDTDFSGEYYRESLILHKLMSESEVEGIRAYGDKLVYAFIKRGSKQHAEWWAEYWLGDYFKKFAESKVRKWFEVSNFTLDDIEILLKKAPADLFNIYKVNPVCLARHLYYAVLPQFIYNRLLTLLAMHRVLKEKEENKGIRVDFKPGTIGRKKLSLQKLACAIENCQKYFWANSAYAVLFCICRDDYEMDLSQTDFERIIEGLPYKKKRDHTCPIGTIANAFSNNPIFSEDVSKWEDYNPMKRIIKLLNELRNELKL